MKRTLILPWLIAAISGCNSGGNHSIAASEFQQSCSVDSDCVPVYEGTLGCCGACANAAVNQVGYTAYQKAASDRRPTCNVQPPCPAFTDVLCKAGAICSNGTCAFEHVEPDASTD